MQVRFDFHWLGVEGRSIDHTTLRRIRVCKNADALKSLFVKIEPGLAREIGCTAAGSPGSISFDGFPASGADNRKTANGERRRASSD